MVCNMYGNLFFAQLNMMLGFFFIHLQKILGGKTQLLIQQIRCSVVFHRTHLVTMNDSK